MKALITPQDIYLDFLTDQHSKDMKKRYEELGYIEQNDQPNRNPYDETGYKKITREEQTTHPVYQKFSTHGKFYHLTSPINAQKILKKGLKSVGIKHNSSIGGPGYIWTVESSNPDVWNAIAYSQVCMGIIGLKSVVLEIDPQGITGEIFGEIGADQTTHLHTVIKQDHIHSKYITKVDEVITDRLKYYNFRMSLLEINQPEIFQRFLAEQNS
jgi:hypothetical protein